MASNTRLKLGILAVALGPISYSSKQVKRKGEKLHGRLDTSEDFEQTFYCSQNITSKKQDSAKKAKAATNKWDGKRFLFSVVKKFLYPQQVTVQSRQARGTRLIKTW